jgi:hypothetical protein
LLLRKIPTCLFRNMVVKHISKWNHGICSILSNADAEQPTTDNYSKPFKILKIELAEFAVNTADCIIISFNIKYLLLNLIQKWRTLQVLQLLRFIINWKCIKFLRKMVNVMPKRRIFTLLILFE